MKNFDIIVIGSGGGAKIASPAAKLGCKVAVIEKDKLGGTCLNRGCIPSKMLIHPADVADEIRQASRFSILNDPKFSVNFSELINRISATVDLDSESIGRAYAKNPNIDYYNGAAKFVSDKVVEVNGEELTADKIFITVGTRPQIPDFPGLAGTPFWTSTEALRNVKLPKKMIVIGASYIAVEIGYAYAALGCDVHFIVRSQFLRREDSQVAEEFTRVFKKKYQCHIGFDVERINHQNGEFSVSIKNAAGLTQIINAEALLIATGIVSNADTLSLSSTNIKVDKNNFIQVDDYLRTAVPGVYAFGDCIGRYFFRHSVNFEGDYLYRTLFADPSDEPIVYPAVPHAIFTNPQVAGVGLTEDECKQQGLSYAVGVNPYSKSAMGMALLAEEGFCKVIIERQTRKLIGAHIIGKDASDLIHMLIAYMTMNATIDDLLKMIYIHPALSEIVRNAARMAKIALDGELIPVKPKKQESNSLTW